MNRFKNANQNNTGLKPKAGQLLLSTHPHQITNITAYLVLAVLQVVLVIYVKAPLYSFVHSVASNSEGITATANVILLLGMSLPTLLILWIWLETVLNDHLLTHEQLTIRFGILNRSSEYLELYRVKDFDVYEPFFYRLFGVGSIVLYTSDKKTPEFQLKGMRRPKRLANMLRKLVERARTEKGVREFD